MVYREFVRDTMVDLLHPTAFSILERHGVESGRTSHNDTVCHCNPWKLTVDTILQG